MYVVAITLLATSIADEAAALARDLGTLPYEQRQRLTAGVPAIVLTTPDRTRAERLRATVAARGHDVWLGHRDDIADSDAMTAVRRFDFSPVALVLDDGARLAWHDVAVLVHAVHRTTSPERSLLRPRPVVRRAIAAAGRANVFVESLEAVLYIFARGRAPWLVRELHVHYDALGDRLSPSSTHNFARLVDELRRRAPRAAFDARLVQRKGAARDVDLLAHVIAQTVAEHGTPFR